MREASTGLLVELDPESNVTDLLLEQHAKDPVHALYSRKGPGGWTDVSVQHFLEQVTALAKGLIAGGLTPGETVAVMSATRYEWTVVDFAIWFAGGVTVPIYETSSAAQVEWILHDSGARRVFVEDHARAALVQGVLDASTVLGDRLVAVVRMEHDGAAPNLESLAAAGAGVTDAELERHRTAASLADVASLVYTSGTTGKPKGVVYHHRGAYLNAVSNILEWAMPHHPVYLWTLPMFHCNGWCYPWAVTAVAGTHICLRHVRADHIFSAISRYKVTHFCGAPVVLNMMLNAPEEQQIKADHEVTVTTGGAAPPASIIEGMEALGIQVVHAYGLTETYGPSVFCDPQEAWTELPLREKAKKMARQGVRAPGVADLSVVDMASGRPVPQDGETQGEVLIRSNSVMKGYLSNPEATAEAFKEDWFHTGDIAVWHPDGYIEVKDRFKDVIISGGENISTIEVEGVLFQHPAIMEAAVVARPDEFWGEVPCAVVTLKDGQEASAEEIILFCRENLAHFKTPKQVVFAPLPKTSTGKIQKFALRELVKALA